MTDTIVYTLIGKGGGVDGRDHTDKPGRLNKAYLTRQQAEKDPNVAWSDIKPEVVDLAKQASAALDKLDAIDQLALAVHPAVLTKLLPGPTTRLATYA